MALNSLFVLIAVKKLHTHSLSCVTETFTILVMSPLLKKTGLTMADMANFRPLSNLTFT